ncbi:MAG: endopeptidase La [Candidatus Brocadiia bacterium]
MTDDGKTADVLPLIALRNMVMFPGVITALRVGRPRSVAALEAARDTDGRLVLVSQREAAVDQPAPDDLYEVGVVAQLRGAVQREEGWNVMVEGQQRCRVLQYVQETPHIAVRWEPWPDTDASIPNELVNRVQELFAATRGGGGPAGGLDMLTESGYMEYAIAFALELSVEKKQEFLNQRVAEDRYRMLVPVLETEKRIAAASRRLREGAEEGISEEERRRYLEERKERIEGALGDVTGEGGELDEIRNRLDEADLPEEARREADRELGRLSRMHSGAPEYSVAMDYLEWLSELPWNETTDAHVDLKEAHRVLDRDHYDRDEVKERILEYLSVRQLRPEREGALLCFVGAPGVGKTSLGRSIAEATGRKFQRISLGGVRDEAEIRGHRRTYIGALPGRIVRALRDVGVANPVLMLDEVDKLRISFRGDPTSALLEVLDPEQNREFVDNYLAVPFDLSRIMFIGTANTTDTIPPALLDRLEVIELSGYSTEEKMAIAREYLIPRQLERTGLEADSLRIEDDAVQLLIEGYTREAGVRSLERQLASVCRKLAREQVGGRWCLQELDAERVKDLLGPPQYVPERQERPERPGICPTLAVGPSGGRLLEVEISRVAGKGNLIVTGRAGEALKESATLAFNFWRSHAERFGFDTSVLEESDFHVHLPAGALPKEGTSAGLAIALAFASILADVPVPAGVAMIGEVTLHGRVLQADRLPERLAAARRVAIERVLVPERNRADVEKARREQKLEGLDIEFVSSIAEAVSCVFNLPRTVAER